MESKLVKQIQYMLPLICIILIFILNFFSRLKIISTQERWAGIFLIVFVGLSLFIVLSKERKSGEKQSLIETISNLKIGGIRLIQFIKSKYFWIAVLVLNLGMVLNKQVSYVIHNSFGDSLPVLWDVILNNIPFYKSAIVVYDLFSVLPLFLILIYAYKKESNKLAYFILLVGLQHLIRGIFIGLTPFGNPNGRMVGLFGGTMFRDGVYPSGHTGVAFLACLITKGWYKKIAYFFLGVEIISLLLGRGHYSIDILSAILFVYALYAFGERYLMKKFIINKEEAINPLLT